LVPSFLIVGKQSTYFFFKINNQLNDEIYLDYKNKKKKAQNKSLNPITNQHNIK
jgi:hypothetical protein